MAVNLANLPDLNFTEKSASAIQADIISTYERISQTTLQRADPVRLFLDSLAYLIYIQNNLIDLAGKQNLLAYAQGGHLDHLGALMGVERIEAQPSTCTMRFEIAATLTFDLIIPQGTRTATQDGKIVFKTLSEHTIAKGDLYVDCPSQALTAGADSNGLVEGQINCLVDPLPYVISVKNISETLAGSDIESDDRLRERIRLAPESYSVAGPAGEYEARCLAVSADIENVAVYSEAPGVVNVCFTTSGGNLPDSALIEKVYNELSAETVRPLTDTVKVAAPLEYGYNIKGKWYASKSDAVLLSAINQKVSTALSDYVAWQDSKPGRDINPVKLISLVEQAGAKRLILEEPVFTELKIYELGRVSDITFDFAGFEDD